MDLGRKWANCIQNVNPRIIPRTVTVSFGRSHPIAAPQRRTRQRDVILAELRRLSSHPTASDLFQTVRRHLPRVSLGTVYRNLDQLAEAGVIRKLQTGSGSTRFDGNIQPHYHVRCQKCGRVDDLHDAPADTVRDGITNLSGYEILGHRLEFIGLCPECRRRTGDHDLDVGRS